MAALGLTGFFVFSSKSKVDKKNELQDKIQTFPGYRIVNCEKVEITDEVKAFEYAFNIGFKDPNNFATKLFGSVKCVDAIKGEDAYDLIETGFTGADASGKMTASLDEVADLLNKYRELLGLTMINHYEIKENYLNTLCEFSKKYASNIYSDVKRPGYRIVNCKYVWIYDWKNWEAFNYVYSEAFKDPNPTYDKFKNSILGGCNPEKIISINSFYTLYTHYVTGGLKGDKSKIPGLVLILKDYAKELGLKESPSEKDIEKIMDLVKVI